MPRLSLLLMLICGAVFSRGTDPDAEYSLSCSMQDGVATVYACNSGNSAEGNNHYVTVTACEDRRDGCDSDYDLMYVYASPGDCDEIGQISFGSEYVACFARFRDSNLGAK